MVILFESASKLFPEHLRDCLKVSSNTGLVHAEVFKALFLHESFIGALTEISYNANGITTGGLDHADRKRNTFILAGD